MLAWIYKSVLQHTTPLLDAYLDRRMRAGKEDGARAHERRGAPSMPRPSGKLVWCHAASVGESLSLLKVVMRLRQDYPAASVMVTTGTVTSAKLMAERLPSGAFHQYVPVDHPQWVENFLAHWRPDAVLWAESEFWPNMLAAVRARRIPAVLLNARMSEETFRRWKWARGLIGDILAAFDLCLAQNSAEADRLLALGARAVKISGNLKYAADPLPVDPHALEVLQRATDGRRMALFASTHKGEEDIALDAHLALKKNYPNLLTVIVPRHPARGDEIAALCHARGLATAQRSRGQTIDKATDIYLADTLGELGLFYTLCPVVVMGGSFADIGGHNPIEPAQKGCLVICGPQMYNFKGVMQDFASDKALVTVESVAALALTLNDIFANPGAYADIARAAAELTRRKGHIVEELSQALDPVIGVYLRQEVAA